MIATEVRHLQRTEVGEVEEGFRPGQKGSSAMPHKRNPITAERLSGLARILRGNLSAGLEDVSLWHERDISHSSVERVILPDSSLLAYYVLRKCASLIDGLRVDTSRCSRTSISRSGWCSANPCCSRSSRPGSHVTTPTESSRRTPRPHAPTASRSARSSRRTSVSRCTADQLDDAFGLDRALRNTAGTLRRDGRRRVTFTKTYSGKVRDLYDAADGSLLMVASDRMSAFDVVMARADARQGSHPHGDERLLVRPPRRHRPEPPDLGDCRYRGGTRRAGRGA